MDYNKLTIAELREAAKAKGIRNVSTMKKKELVELLENVEKMMHRPVEETKKEAAPKKAGGRAPRQSAGKSETAQQKSDRTEAAQQKSDKAETAQQKAGRTEAAQQKRGRTDAAARRGGKTESAAGKRGRTEAAAGKNGRPAEAASETTNAVKTERKAEIVARKQEVPAVVEKQPEAQDDRMEIVPSEPKEARALVYDGQEYNPALSSGSQANGILEVMPEGYGFIRSDNYMPGEKDIYVSPAQIRKFGLKTGDIISGPIRKRMQQTEKFQALLYIESVNGLFPSQVMKRKPFESLTPVFPDDRIRLDYTGAPVSLRIVDLFSPIGKGQRGMIVSPPKAGKTTLLKQIAKRISVAYPEVHVLVLLIDERPEEVTDIKESITASNAEVIYSTFDELPEHHKRVSEMVIERAKRMVESGKDVVILLDSLTRLARAYNLTVSPSGRTLSGGLDPAALHMPKKFFGAARNMREGGSLTILATALIETGSRMDDVVFEEFKGTGNMELVLNRSLSERRVFPAIDIAKSGTRRDDLLLSNDEREVLDLMHQQLRGTKSEEATEDIIKLFGRTRNNMEFLDYARKVFSRTIR